MRVRVDVQQNDSATDFGREMNGNASRSSLGSVLRQRSAQTAKADAMRYQLSMGLVGYFGGLVLVIPVVVFLASVRQGGVGASTAEVNFEGSFRADASGPSLISVPTLVGRDLALPVPLATGAMSAGARTERDAIPDDTVVMPRPDHLAAQGAASETVMSMSPTVTDLQPARQDRQEMRGPEARDSQPSEPRIDASQAAVAPTENAGNERPKSELPAGTIALARARELFRSGAILDARRVLTLPELVDRGEALFMLAETYDPNVLAAIGAIGVAAEASLARRHYAAASEKGITAASTRLEALD